MNSSIGSEAQVSMEGRSTVVCAPRLKPEESFFLHCATLLPIDEELQPAGVDIGQVLKLADHYRCLPVTCHNLQKAGLAGNWINPYLSALHARVVQTRVVFDETEALAQEFGREGIKIVVWKGLTINHTLYPAIHLRPSFDIDLLAHPREAKRAAEILMRRGYRFLQHLDGESGFARELNGQSILVEIHTDVPYFERGFLEAALETAVEKQFGNVNIWCLNDTDDFSALVSYVTVNKPIRCLSYLNDYDAMIQQRDIHWDRLLERKRWRTNIYIILFMLRELFGRDLAVVQLFEPGGWQSRVVAKAFARERFFRPKTRFEKLLRYLLFRRNSPHMWSYMFRETHATLKEMFSDR